MMIDIPRLFSSEFDATDDDSAWRFGVTLWLKSFHQVPAASLPTDEGSLAKLCGLGRDVKTWRRHSAAAMRGWVLCSDGRLYHPVVAEVALEAWLDKLAQRLSSGAGNAARWGTEFDPEPIKADIGNAARMLAALNPKSEALSKQQVAKALKRSERDTASEIPTGQHEVPAGQLAVPAGSQGKGREGKKETEAKASLSPGKPASAKPKGKSGPVPDEFPDLAAQARAEAMVADAGVHLDVAAHVRRFRAHALAQDRRAVDWNAAWVGWIEIEIAKATAAATTVRAAEWAGPPDVLAAVEGAFGDAARGRSYLASFTWRDGPERAIVSANRFAVETLRKHAEEALTAIGVKIQVASGRAA